MRKLFALFILLVLAVVVVWNARAGSTLILGSMTTVNGTTNTAGTLIGSVYPPRGTFSIQNGGLSSTNELTVNVQLSIDGTNYFTVGTYIPSATNATTEAYTPTFTGVSIYMRAQVVTTGAVQVGGVYTQ